ncbi:unnamed protein product [Sphagnum troendelagicum]
MKKQNSETRGSLCVGTSLSGANGATALVTTRPRRAPVIVGNNARIGGPQRAVRRGMRDCGRVLRESWGRRARASVVCSFYDAVMPVGERRCLRCQGMRSVMSPRTRVSSSTSA